MKGNLTIIVRDNDKNEDLVTFDVNAVNYKFSDADSVRILAYLETPRLGAEDEITQEITDCRFGHTVVTETSFTTEVTFCEKCGLELHKDAL